MMDISKRKQVKRGFTLIEILIVVVIATVLLSIAIPRIRAVNKERNLREAARVVGSAFANASQRAVIDGVGGVRITRNGNFLAGTQQFAATEISLLRAVPNFAGDQLGATATVTGTTITIARPLEQDSLNIIQEGDSISFGGSSVRYRIDSIVDNETPAPGNLVLTLNRGTNNYLPLPATGATPTYIVHRRPRLLRSSITPLPRGNIIDLRYSGFEVLDGQATPGLTSVFELDPMFNNTPTDPTNYAIDVVFAEDGSIDRVFYIDQSGETVSRVPLGPLSFFIRETPNTFDSTMLNVATADAQALWVSVSSNGTSNIGYNNQTQLDPAPAWGTTEMDFADLYNNDRDEFNAVINAARDNSLSTAATQ